MKRLVGALAIGGLIWGGAAAIATAGGQPNINNANATISVKPTGIKTLQCVGVNGVPYMTWLGSWKGSEILTGPAFTPYNLSGAFTVNNWVWTVNLKTDRGVLTGTASLKSAPAAGGPVAQTFQGPLTLITQGLPDQGSTNGTVPARGWMNTSTYTAGAKDGGSLLANLEVTINPGLSATGQYGDLNPSLGFPDYSVTTDNQSCAGPQKP
jgi:hypothetical protein